MASQKKSTKFQRECAIIKLDEAMKKWSALNDADLFFVAKERLSILSEATREECIRILVIAYCHDHLEA
jgi:hypothetical protein